MVKVARKIRRFDSLAEGTLLIGMAKAFAVDLDDFKFAYILLKVDEAAMKIFEGTYMLERKEDPGASPIHACAWQVKLIDLSSKNPSHSRIRPFAVLAFRKKGGIFQTSCAESLGKRICKDLKLDVVDVLWVETFPDLPETMHVAIFTPRYQGGERAYTVNWRPILDNEKVAVAPWC